MGRAAPNDQAAPGAEEAVLRSAEWLELWDILATELRPVQAQALVVRAHDR